MNLRDKQLHLESTYSKEQVQEDNCNTWFSILTPLLAFYAQEKEELTNLEPEEIEYQQSKELDNIIKVLYILDDRRAVPYDTLISMLLTSWGKTNKTDNIAKAARLLDLGEQYNLWTYRQIPIDDFALEVRVRYFLPIQIKGKLEKCFYKLPMVVPPEPVRNNKSNKGSGYLLNKQDNLILHTKKKGGDICREFLDKANNVGFNINYDFLKICDHNLNTDKIKNNLIERGHYSVWETMALAQENWKQYLNQREIVLGELDTHTFYLTHKYDTRGRCYAQGYHINYQGDSFCKAMIELAQTELISNHVNFYSEGF